MRADLDFFMTDQENEYLISSLTIRKSLAEPHFSVGYVALYSYYTLSDANIHALVRSNVVFNRNEEYPVYERSLVDGELF
ncbi:D-lysergyl-peptide-synthetase subunit 1 [Frankliniella fusca]|uniref:D-lysergyl-peptide-synthetase subunit 1 n=1 Tax=Frankliniella fusca TaxID=407009 RepID=A0AAE1H7U2_9NEOP|nr:D-lysergyl-peptide-synthetase subunit 1 [Frankliniella fusca]